jgi:hypothetical protein
MQILLSTHKQIILFRLLGHRRVPPPPPGYLARKAIVISLLEALTICKILITSGLAAKYCQTRGYGLSGLNGLFRAYNLPVNRISERDGVIRHVKTPVWSGFCRLWGLTEDFSVFFGGLVDAEWSQLWKIFVVLLIASCSDGAITWTDRGVICPFDGSLVALQGDFAGVGGAYVLVDVGG